MDNVYWMSEMTKFSHFEQITPDLTRCKCYVLAIGKNRNYSFFRKEAVDAALPTLWYVPVVGHLIYDNDGSVRMGGHDMDIEITPQGLAFVDKCVPYGIVPYQDATYETVVEDGEEKTYLVVDVLFWTGRYPIILDARYDDHIWFGQSMEITPIRMAPLDDDPQYQDISDFRFSALCLLGKSDDPNKHVEPCFKSAKVSAYSCDDDEFNRDYRELKQKAEEFSAKFERTGGSSGVNKELIDAIFAEFEISQEEIDFEISEEMTEEVLREKVNGFAKLKEANGCIGELTSQLESVQGEFEAYKGTHTNSDEDFEAYKSTHTNTDEDFEAYKNDHSHTNEEFDALQNYKNEKEKEAHEAEMDAVVSEFEDLKDKDEYAEIKANAYSFESADALRKEFYAVRGKYAVVSGKKSKSDTAKFQFNNEEPVEDEPYGDLFKK